MRIAIAGYGQMGRLIRQKALVRGHETPVIIDPKCSAPEVTARELTSTALPLDVIIDFTTPDVVLRNIERYGELGLTAVIGTTGWYSEMGKVAEIVEKSGIGLIWSGNFSLGVNLFLQLIEAAGKIMNRFSQYDVMVHEYHHRLKADSPSGTAKMIGEKLITGLDRKQSIVSDSLNRRIEDSEIHISSTRGGSIPGIHRVSFDSEVDTIILEHSARDRGGFADGALLAAEWIYGRSGLFNIDDLMQSVIGGEAI